MHGALGAVPDDARPQLGEAVGGVAAVEHVEHVLQLLAGELVEGLRGGDEALDLVDLPLVEGRHRDQLLGEHVEWVLRDHRLLDRAFAHALGDDRALEQVGAELGEDAAARDLAQGVAGAADPLQATADRLRRLDLNHQVDSAHVDAQLEGRRRDETGELARLEELLDDRALLVGQGAVVGTGNLNGGGWVGSVGPAFAGSSRRTRPIRPRRTRPRMLGGRQLLFDLRRWQAR